MEQPENQGNAENAENGGVETKQTIRKKVWDYLEVNDLVMYPRPVHGRIPNFKNCETAAAHLTELDEFKTSQNVKVNPDKPQSPVRFAVLENGKNLFVPIPRLASGLLKHIILPEDASKDDIRKGVSQKGIEECGKDISLNDRPNIDLIVLGSVAVSKEGYRIGKGKGYADLEFGILSQMKAVNQNTIVITTVHDSQVYDTLPEHLFQMHDVPVDIIVTPTRVIRVEKPLPKPTGIIWSILTQQRLDMIPILQTLRDADEREGKDVTLKESGPDVKSFKPRRRRPQIRNKRRSEGKTSESSEKELTENNNIKPLSKRRKPRNSRPQFQQNAESENTVRRRSKKNRRNLNFIDFSLMVRNIDSNVHIREFKAALAEQGVKPKIIMWRGVKGYCCLHFTKTSAGLVKTAVEDVNADADASLCDKENDTAIGNIMNALQNLRLSPDSPSQLSVEVMKPLVPADEDPELLTFCTHV